MVQILKKQRSGFTIVEMLVAMVILSIGVLAFVSMVKVTTKFGKQSTTNDAAYSIARQRLALMQDGELLVRAEYQDSMSRDGVTYYTLDQVEQGVSGLPPKLTVTVSWGTPTRRSVTLSGYLNRGICPDTAGNVTPPTALTISNATIPESSAVNTFVGELKIHDPDSSDLHMYLYEDSLADNELFKIEKSKLYTADILSVGNKELALGVSDCAGNDTVFNLIISVTPYDSVPKIEDQSFTIDENSIAGTEVGKVIATPLSVSFKILSQHPVAPFSIGSDGTLRVASSAGMDYEISKDITLEVEVTNLQWKDTGTVIVTQNNLNEPPTAIYYNGRESVKIGVPVSTALGLFTVEDPDTNDTYTVTIDLGSTSGLYFRVNTFDSIVTNSELDTAGTYLVGVTAKDAGGLTATESFIFSVIDSASTGCKTLVPDTLYDTITVTDEYGDPITTTSGMDSVEIDTMAYEKEVVVHEFMDGYTYNKYDIVYNNNSGDSITVENYIFVARQWVQNPPVWSPTTNFYGEWSYLGACSDMAQCADFVAFAHGTEYNAGAIVYDNGAVYKATTYSKNATPRVNPSKWKELSQCE